MFRWFYANDDHIIFFYFGICCSVSVEITTNWRCFLDLCYVKLWIHQCCAIFHLLAPHNFPNNLKHFGCKWYAKSNYFKWVISIIMEHCSIWMSSIIHFTLRCSFIWLLYGEVIHFLLLTAHLLPHLLSFGSVLRGIPSPLLQMLANSLIQRYS